MQHIESWELRDQLIEIFQTELDDIYYFNYYEEWMRDVETISDVLRIINEKGEEKALHLPSGHIVVINKPHENVTGYDMGTVSILFATTYPGASDVRYFVAETEYESFNIPAWKYSDLNEVVIKRQTVLEYKRY